MCLCAFICMHVCHVCLCVFVHLCISSCAAVKIHTNIHICTLYISIHDEMLSSSPISFASREPTPSKVCPDLKRHICSAKLGLLFAAQCQAAIWPKVSIKQGDNLWLIPLKIMGKQCFPKNLIKRGEALPRHVILSYTCYSFIAIIVGSPAFFWLPIAMMNQCYQPVIIVAVAHIPMLLLVDTWMRWLVTNLSFT